MMTDSAVLWPHEWDIELNYLRHKLRSEPKPRPRYRLQLSFRFADGCLDSSQVFVEECGKTSVFGTELFDFTFGDSDVTSDGSSKMPLHMDSPTSVGQGLSALGIACPVVSHADTDVDGVDGISDCVCSLSDGAQECADSLLGMSHDVFLDQEDELIAQ